MTICDAMAKILSFLSKMISEWFLDISSKKSFKYQELFFFLKLLDSWKIKFNIRSYKFETSHYIFIII